MPVKPESMRFHMLDKLGSKCNNKCAAAQNSTVQGDACDSPNFVHEETTWPPLKSIQAETLVAVSDPPCTQV